MRYRTLATLLVLMSLATGCDKGDDAKDCQGLELEAVPTLAPRADDPLIGLWCWTGGEGDIGDGTKFPITPENTGERRAVSFDGELVRYYVDGQVDQTYRYTLDSLPADHWDYFAQYPVDSVRESLRSYRILYQLQGADLTLHQPCFEGCSDYYVRSR